MIGKVDINNMGGVDRDQRGKELAYRLIAAAEWDQIADVTTMLMSAQNNYGSWLLADCSEVLAHMAVCDIGQSWHEASESMMLSIAGLPQHMSETAHWALSLVSLVHADDVHGVHGALADLRDN